MISVKNYKELQLYNRYQKHFFTFLTKLFGLNNNPIHINFGIMILRTVRYNIISKASL